MAAALPTFTPFEPASETWDDYLARFECFLQANDLTDLPSARKRGYFLSSCGREIFGTARALAAPQPVFTVPWETLLEKLKNHYAPTPSKIARRHAFHQRSQRAGESISDYMASLRMAALHCEFHELDDMLLDQLVCGVRDLKLQRRLLAHSDLTLPIAMDEARASEMSAQSSAEIQRSQPGGLPLPISPQSVHYEDSDAEDDAEPEGGVSRLKTTRKPRGPTSAKSPLGSCLGCGGQHSRAECRFKSAVCRRCGKRGHLSRVCRATLPLPETLWEPTPKRQKAKRFDHRETAVNQSLDAGIDAVGVSHASAPCSASKIYLTVLLESSPCRMEVDTGSSRSLIAWSTLKALVPRVTKKRLQPCSVQLKDYQGRPIPTLGCGYFSVVYGSFSGQLPLMVVRDSLPSLLGLDWFAALQLGVTGIHTIGSDISAELTREFAEVFDGQLGKYKGLPISFNLDPQVAPIRLKPRRVPLALRARVDQELDKLIAQGVLQPVEHSSWETPIVIPLKPDGSIRICADYKATLNRALQANHYPVPVVQHLLHSLGHGRVFAKLDLAQAYQQLPVDEATALAQTIVTHRGAFKCTRLQFGVSVAPGIFQSLMERLLHGLQGVVPYFDDVLIAAADQDDLITKLRAVLSRFKQAGLRLKAEKCRIGVPHVEFLGFLIDAAGIHPAPAKVAAIKNAPVPTSRAELQAFLGLLNFYAVFLPHKASLAEPLHRLLDKRTPWVWSNKAAASFQAVKDMLVSDAVLVQYDECLPLSLTCDASPYGVGAVLSHILPNGVEAPVAYYSRTLSAAERNYSQIDREALAAVAGIKRFHDYVYGRFFYLVTDHKPLLGLLAADRQTPPVLSPRMSRWLEFLAAYSYRLQYKPGKAIGHADALSRCPLPLPLQDPAPTAHVLLVDELSPLVTAVEVRSQSASDPVLSQVLDWVRRGWPQSHPAAEYLPYFHRQHELSVQAGCLLWGHRVVVPPSLRKVVLSCLHDAHPGVVRMKALGRSYIWWPAVDKDIEEWVARCHTCQLSRPVPPAAPVQEWESPRTPWARVHLDLAGPFQGRTFLIAVDAYSKWVELALMPSTTTENVTRVLEGLFATHGLPDMIVTDNGPQFTSAPFQLFLARLGIRHARTAPSHPAANGQAERAVRSAKEALRRLGTSDWHHRVYQYLLAQHSTPTATTKHSPAELLMGRRLRITLDRLHPSYTQVERQGTQGRVRTFAVGDLVFALNFNNDARWLPGQIIQLTGPYSYRVQLTDGRIWKRHINQLMRRVADTAGSRPFLESPHSPPPAAREVQPRHRYSDHPHQPELPVALPEISKGVAKPDDPAPVSSGPSFTPDSEVPAPPATTANPGLRRSERCRRPPAYLADYACAVRVERGVESSLLRFPPAGLCY